MLQSRCLLILSLSAAGPASAQPWTAVRLHPATAEFSQVYAVGAGVQGGTLRDAAQIVDPPMLWRGSSASGVPLASAEGTVGGVLGIWEDVQVGYLNSQAAMWRGTPESFVSLAPFGSSGSGIGAVRGDMQVGSVSYPGIGYHAAVWRGTAASFVDLHPPGAFRSIANATDGTLQGGSVTWNQAGATIWNGSAQSAVDLSPGGHESEVTGMAPGIQVGWAYYNPGGYHAGVWHGSAASWVDYNPPGGDTRFLATTGRIHVGDGFLNSQPGGAYAVLNFGAPDAWLDLRPFLPPGYTGFSAANAVYQDGPTIYVGGYASKSVYEQAFLWIGTDPCYPNCDQSTASPMLNVSDFVCFLNKYAQGDPYANCDGSTTPPILNVNDFICFLDHFALGCP